MNTLVIEKQTGGYFKFTLNGDTANAITSIQNDLLAVGTQLHFKTGNGANIIKEQFIYPADVTIIASGTFTFTTVAQVWDKLIDIDYFAWLGGGGTGGVDRFDDLLDTFSYTGNAGKAVVVDGSELRLVPITLYNKRLFTELEDTPSSLVPNKMLVVNPAGTAVVLQDQPEQPEQLLNSVGYFDYNDLITQTTPLNAVANVALKLTNDTEGANTSTDQNPYGVSYVWDYTTNAFNFSELEVGDTIDVRVHVQVTTTSANQRVLLSAKFGIGSIAEFTNIIYENQFKSAGLHEINFVAPFYMGSTYITDNPAELYLTSDASATVKVDGWYVRILRKNINIITVDYTVPDATTTVKGIVRLAGDLAGTANSPTVPELANKVPTSRTVSTTSPLLGGGALSSNLTLSIQQANSVDSGYLTYADWGRFDEAHRDRIVSAAVTGTTTKTLTLTQHDAGTITTSWTDDNTDAVSSVFGRTGAVVAVSGDYTTSLVTESTNKNYQTDNQKLYNDATSSIQTQLNSKANDNAVVKLTGDQTISGVKTFSNPTIFNSSLNIASGAYSILYNPANSAYWQTYVDSSNVFNFGYNGNIVKASISNSGNFTANSFIKSGGTSSQFLKADGSVDSSTYALTSQIHDAVTLGTTGVLNGLSLSGQVLSLATASSTTRGALTSEDYNYFYAKQNALTNPVTGTGTTNYIPKFTGASAIGNSLIYDNGTNVGIGTTSPLTGGGAAKWLTLEGSTYSGGIIGSVSGVAKFYNYFDNASNTAALQGASGVGVTLWSDSTERMRITSGGNVGIGTTSPSTLFHIYKASFPILTIQSSSYQSSLGIDTTSGNLVLNNESNAPLSFNTNATERMRITSGGALLVGTTTDAGYKLDVNGTGRISSYLDINYQASAANGSLNIDSADPTIRFRVSGGTANKRIYELRAIAAGGTNDRLELRTWNDAQNAASSLLSITNGGNVGIGTTSPAVKFHSYGGALSVGDESSYSARFSNNSNKGVVIGYDSTNNKGHIGSINPAVAWTDLILNANGGNVGIGTTSPQKKLHVANGNDGAIQLGSSTYYGIIEHDATSTGANIYTTAAASGGGHIFKVGTSEYMRITSGGNVGIGTTAPSEKLTVSNGKLALTTDDVTIGGKIYGYNDTSVNLYSGGLKFQTRYFDGSNYVYSDRLTLNSSGNVGIGTTSPGGKLHVVGEGIFDDGTNGRLTFANASSQNDIYSTTTSFGGWKNLRLSSNELILSSGGNTERMRITSGGDVCIGKTLADWTSEGFQTEGNATTLGVTNSSIANNLFLRKNGVAGNVIAFYYDGTSVGSIAITSSTTGYYTSSDYRLKTDLKSFNGLDLVSQIKVYDYEWKIDNTRSFGVMAHELQEILPQAVTGEKDAEQMQSVDYSKLVPILVQAIQEQQKQIDELKTLINK